ncbi:MAG TPA: phage holin family protein [Blastocatellia bacterium]|nr:phage holin family protein [Blastocatellia bacterium]
MQTRPGFDPQANLDAQRESFGVLLGQLANDSAALVRDEIALAKQEMTEKVSAFKSGVVVLVAGAVIGLLAVLTLLAAAVIGLGNIIGPGYSALLIGVVLAVVAGIICAMGMRRLKETSLKPEQTIETLEEDKEWLKELT